MPLEETLGVLPILLLLLLAETLGALEAEAEATLPKPLVPGRRLHAVQWLPSSGPRVRPLWNLLFTLCSLKDACLLAIRRNSHEFMRAWGYFW